MSRVIKWVLAIAAVLALLYWPLTRPLYLSLTDLPEHVGNPVNGELIFHAGGCSACHGEDLAGGQEMETAFGTFLVPNISPDSATGIGDWNTLEMVNAMMLGSAPDGTHYYPAFPYASYTRMKVQDVIDLKTYMDTLEPVENHVAPHRLHFPWSMRRGIGLWKMRYLRQGAVEEITTPDPEFERGRYLVEGAGHCGECHTPRDLLGGMRLSQWLAGGANPDGEGKIPNITPHPNGLSSWSDSDIAYYLESGFTPDFDTVGGSMVKVQEHMAMLPDSDRKAIAVYLKSIPARP